MTLAQMKKDYSNLATLWAKTLAYLNCGKLEAASTWAQALVDELRDRGVHIN